MIRWVSRCDVYARISGTESRKCMERGTDCHRSVRRIASLLRICMLRCLWHCCDNGKCVYVSGVLRQKFMLQTNSWMSAESCSMLNFTIRWPAAAEREFLLEVIDIISICLYVYIYIYIRCERTHRRCSLLCPLNRLCDVMRAWRSALTTLNNWNCIHTHFARFRLCCARPCIYTALAHS